MDIDIYCPNCNIDHHGVSRSRGALFNPCDGGCCATLACKRCRRVFTLVDHGRILDKHDLVDWYRTKPRWFWWWLKFTCWAQFYGPVARAWSQWKRRGWILERYRHRHEVRQNS